MSKEKGEDIHLMELREAVGEEEINQLKKVSFNNPPFFMRM